jgi:hypothetical protein
MNSPSTALLWELWRKNRWGFAALLILLGLCALIAWQARRTQIRADTLNVQNPNRIVVPAKTLMTASRNGSGALRVELGAKAVFDGPLIPNHSLVAEARFDQFPELRLTLQSESPTHERYGRVAAGPQAAEAGAEPNTPKSAAASTTLTNRLSPDEVVLDDGPLRGRVLRWSVGGGPWHTLNLNFDPNHGEEVAAAALSAETWSEAGLAWSVVWLGFGFLIILGIFGAAEPHARLGFTGLPPRRFTLPASTASLVAWPIGLGCLTVALFSLAWFRIVSAGGLWEDTPLIDGYYALLLMTGLVLFQALVWGLPSFPKTRAWLITLLVLGLVAMAAIAPVSPRSGPTLDWAAAWPWVLSGLGLVWACGVGMAGLAATLERRGTWTAWTRSSAGGDFVRRLLPRPLEFRSPAEAQSWIEWRRNGRLALAIWTAFVCLLTAADIVVRGAWGTIGIYSVGLPCSFAWVAIVGLNLARDPASGRLALSSFTAVRPVASGALVRAKVMLAASLWVKAMLILGLGWVISLQTADQFNIGISLQTADQFNIGIVVFLAISLNVLAGILPLCLTGRWPGFPWSVLPLALIYGTLLNVAVWVNEHGRYDLLFALVATALALKLVVAFWGFRRALRLRISSWQFVAGYSLFWCAAAGLLIWLACRAGARPDWLENTFVWIPAAALAVPLARVSLSPLALAMNRHR